MIYLRKNSIRGGLMAVLPTYDTSVGNASLRHRALLDPDISTGQKTTVTVMGVSPLYFGGGW